MPVLSCARAVAREKIDQQVERGVALRNSAALRTHAGRRSAYDETDRWARYTHTLLAELFNSSVIADEFDPSIQKLDHDPDGAGVFSMDPTDEEQIGYFQDFIDPKINRLKSISERLDFFGEPAKEGSSRSGFGGMQSALVALIRFKPALYMLLLPAAISAAQWIWSTETPVKWLVQHAFQIAFMFVLLTTALALFDRSHWRHWVGTAFVGGVLAVLGPLLSGSVDQFFRAEEPVFKHPSLLDGRSGRH